VLAVLAVSAGVIHAAGTDGQKCAASKIKAASKKLSANLKCIAKAVSKGAPVDGTCLSNADTKFNGAISKAETRGGCAIPGDGPTFEALVDNDANAIKAFADPNAPVCCFDGTGACWNGTTASDCGIWSVGVAGTVCDGATGGCVAAPAQPGNCCSNPAGVALNGLNGAPPPNCAGGPELQEQPNCVTNVSGSFDPNSLCPPNGGTCIQPRFQ
jgi:hypothetical protein